MVKISLSFACGVLLAMLTNRHLAAGTDTAYMLCSGLLLSSIGCMAALATGRGRAGIQSMAAAFFAGAFCFLSRSICACSDSPALFQGALSAFSAAIDNAGFASEQTPALLKALLCGDRSALDRETIAAFRDSGASHILALSGLHLGVIYLIAGKALSIIGNSKAAKTARSATTVILCGFYAAMTGASPSIVRAFLFILLREILWLLPGRKAGDEGIYCTALTVQLALDPLVISSPGFQLSYMAMAGIYLIFPVLSGLYPDLPSDKGRAAAHRGPRAQLAFAGAMKKIWDAAAMSISCQMFTAPLAWIYFRSFPPFFLITNLISLPLCEALIVCGLASLALPFLAPATDLLARALIFCISVISGL